MNNKYDYSDKNPEWIFEVLAGHNPKPPQYQAALFQRELMLAAEVARTTKKPFFLRVAWDKWLLFLAKVGAYFYFSGRI